MEINAVSNVSTCIIRCSLLGTPWNTERHVYAHFGAKKVDIVIYTLSSYPHYVRGIFV